MQPCPVCHNTGIDANGYCMTCSTYLGQPQQPQYGAPYPGQPVSAPPPTQPYTYAGQPSSAVPYSGAPASAPGYGQASAPSYGAPGYGQPTTPAYGAYQPATPPKKSYTGAIVAASVGLVVLIAAIVVVLVVKSNSGKTPIAGPTGSSRPSGVASASASPSEAGLSACMVGDWKVVSENLSWDFPGYDSVPLSLTSDTPYKVTIRDDGTATENFEAYSDETDYLGQYSGHLFQLAFDGTLTYDYKISGAKMVTTGSVTDGRYGLWIDHDSKETASNDFKDATWTVTCSGSTMTRSLSNDTQRLTRL